MAAFALSACGDSVPGNAVARIGDGSITRTDFDRWFGVAAASNPATAGNKSAYDPPAYTGCVAKKKKDAPKPAKGQPATTDAQYKTQCQQEYEGLRDQVLQFLILEKWVSGEASDQGIKVTDKEKKAAYDKAVKDTFPKEADFQKFLKQSGMTVADARFQVTFNTVYMKLREKAVKTADKVTDKAVADVLQEEQGALRAARDARHPRRADEGQGQGRRRAQGARAAATAGAPSRRSTRSTRPPRARAARCSASPRARRRRRSTTRCSRPTRASSRAP